MPTASRPVSLPIVMTFSASDPTGGAGLQADVLAIAAIGCHAASIVTGVTVQDTAGMTEFVAIDADQVDDQARTILEDMPVAAFKLGVLGDVESVAAIAEVVSDYPGIPCVLDPVLASGRGDVFADDDVLQAMRELLFPQILLVTPNSFEARRLASADDDDGRGLSLFDAAAKLIEFGAAHVLVTGTHEATSDVRNHLFGERDDRCVELRSDAWERLPGQYHGSGCTLASAIAALLACGLALEDAVREGQAYTWETLRAAFRPGMGQAIPDRLYAVRSALRRAAT